jgi:hypothetical protein
VGETSTARRRSKGMRRSQNRLMVHLLFVGTLLLPLTFYRMRFQGMAKFLCWGRSGTTYALGG